VFGLGVTVGNNAVIHAHCHLEGAAIAANVGVGPFARLRPGAKLGPAAKVGNFVEIKNADIGAGAKVSHLSYIGDADVGADANIGAGTITCNYDGFFKYRTVIGANAFIGSNSSLVAPVRISEGAYVGSGSVVTRDVPSGALALSRAQQVVKDGWATRFNRTMAERKASKAKD
jgi:bifunctional UDP-N-acetylglucosamine pyrophosphorylase/glucosamine-1-phosphate N-acetyltransferase